MSGGCQKVTVTGRVNHATRENVLVDEACQAAVTRRVKRDIAYIARFADFSI